jgi:peptide-methionine (R)-S-oxide reductase
MTDKIKKTPAEWREMLSDIAYHVAREKGTEPAFTGTYWDCHDDGTYHCVCCGSALFASDNKFESGTGWPSFTGAVVEGTVATETDTAYGMIRTEALCARCDAHLGHVFPDGPQPSGLRFCINSASLKLEQK